MLFQQPQDEPQQVDLNPSLALEKLDSWVDGFVRLLPNIVVGIVLFIIFYVMARIIRGWIQRRAKARGRENLGTVAGGFIKWVILITGFFLAATIVVPTLKPGDLIAGLGVSSVAIGFAFKDILQNWLAGLLILLRQPFEVDDQIEVNGFEGTVERIETRATIIKQYDNKRVVIPNSDIYTNALKVITANPMIRSQYDVGIGYGDGIEEATEVIRRAVSATEGVSSDRNIDVLPWDLAASWVTIRVRWWTDSQRASVVKTHAAVIRSVKEALDEARIDMPYDTQVHLFHDQTEETDGNRNAQREGWPAPSEGEAPRPRYERELEEKRKSRPAAREEEN